MAKKKKIKRKELLKEQDEFLSFSRRMFGKLMENIRQVAAGLGVLMGILVIIAGIRYLSERSEAEAFEMMARAADKYETAIKDKDADKAYAEVKGDFDLLLDEHSGRDAAKMARLSYAGICFDAGEFDKAISLYEQALDDFRNDLSIKTLILSNLAYAHEAKKDLKTAATYFEKIAQGPESPMKGEAFFHLGRLYKLMDDTEKSENAYKKVVSDYSDSMYAEIAKEKVGADTPEPDEKKEG